MKNPQVMIPRLIERMRQKDVEWRKNQEICNRIWREETDKHFIKSLDHQSIIFKQNDLKLLRAKTIISQFENLYDEVKCCMLICSIIFVYRCNQMVSGIINFIMIEEILSLSLNCVMLWCFESIAECFGVFQNHTEA